MNCDVIVIGGGASGLMAAISAAENGKKVVLLEPNERLGKKLNITGKGRCNLTNDSDLDSLLSNIPRNGKFLYSAFNRFDVKETMSFFEKLGVPLKVERGNRVFPVSDCAFDISDALRKRIHQLSVSVIRDRAVHIVTEENAVAGVNGEKNSYLSSRVIIATGGMSYPATGSTGDGYRLAAELGHTIVEPKGSLVPLVSPSEDCKKMQGLSLKNVQVTVTNGKNKPVYSDFGEMLFTHFGVSGPMILSASAHLRHWEKETYTLSIDLKPALDEQKLDTRILRDISENPNKDYVNIISGLVNHSMVEVVLDRLGTDGAQKANSITKEQRRELVHLLKHFVIPLSGSRSVTEAIITSGGVKVSEINPATMESKLVRGLFFAGEVIDVDAYTGGFNLQIAWSTGRTAGLSAAE